MNSRWRERYTVGPGDVPVNASDAFFRPGRHRNAGLPALVRLGGRLISTVKVRVMVNHSHVAEGNCVAMRRGGEQPEAKRWSVGKRTRFGGMLATSLPG